MEVFEFEIDEISDIINTRLDKQQITQSFIEINEVEIIEDGVVSESDPNHYNNTTPNQYKGNSVV